MLALSLCVIVLMILSGLIVWLLTSGAEPPTPPVVHVTTPAPVVHVTTPEPVVRERIRWLSRKAEAIAAPMPVVAPLPVAPPAAPYVEMVRVRYLDAKGRVIAEESIPRRNRRPQMIYSYKHRRSVFLASHTLPDGTWVYRFQSEE